MKLYIVIPIYVFLAALLGCQHQAKHVDDPTSVLAEHVSGARTEVVAAKGTLKAKDYTSTDQHLDKTLLHLTAEDAVIADVAQKSVETQKQLAKAQDDISKHANDWLGPRAHRWITFTFWTVLILSIATGVLRGFFPASAFFSVASHFVIGVFSFGAGFVHAAAKWLAGKFRKPAADAAV